MEKEKGRQWDGKSRPTTDVYKQRWDEIFGKEDTTKELEKDEQDYLDMKSELDKEDQEYLDSLVNKL